MVAEAPTGPRRRRRRRAHGRPDPQPRRPDARHRRDHPAAPGRGDPGQRPWHHRDHRRPGHRQDRRRPAPRGLPALLRPPPLRVRRHPRRRPLGGLHRLHRARAPVAGRGDGDAALARRRRRRRQHRRGSTRPPRWPHEGQPAHPAAAGAGGSTRLPDGPESFRAFVDGKAVRVDAPVLDRIRARCCATTSATSARGRAQRPRRGRLGERGDGDRAEFMEPVRRPPRGRRVPRRLVAAGRPARRAAVAGRRRAAAPARAGDPHAQEIATCSPRRCAAPSRPAAGRRPTPPSWTTSPPGSARSRTARPRSAGSTRSRSSRTSRSSASPRLRPAWTPAPRSPSRHAPPPPTRASCCSRAIEGPSEYAHVLVDEAQDLSPMQWRMLGRRGRYSSWTVVGDAAQASWPDAVEAGGPRGGVRHPGAPAVPHGHQLPQRPRDLRLRGARSCAPRSRRRHPPGRARDRVSTRSTSPSPPGAGSRRRRRPSRPCSTRSRARSPSSPRRGMPRSWPSWAAQRPGRGHRPDVDQGPRVRRHRHRRPRRDRGRVARRGAGPLRRAHPRGPPDDGAAPDAQRGRTSRTARRERCPSRCQAAVPRSR